MEQIDYKKFGDEYAEQQRKIIEDIIPDGIIVRITLDMIAWAYAFGYQQRRIDEMEEIIKNQKEL